MEAKRACVVVHDPGSEGGMVGRYLERLGYELVEVQITGGPGDPAGSADGLGVPTDYDVIVAMGSTFSLTRPDDLSPWIDDELEFLRAADAADVPVLGVCFGGQALAAAHGGTVVRADRPQIGWFDLEPVPAAPALRGPWMQWHKDRFEPAVGEILAADDVGVQAFSYRRNLGLQFHPEVDRAHLERWMSLGAVPEANKYGIDMDAVLAQTDELVVDSSARVERLVDYFFDEIAQRRVDGE